MSKAIKVMWFNTTKSSLGIVLTENEHGKAVRINSVRGIDEEEDIQNIIDWGAHITLDQARAIVEHLESNQKPKKS